MVNSHAILTKNVPQSSTSTFEISLLEEDSWEKIEVKLDLSTKYSNVNKKTEINVPNI